jgi:hypothetical protein
VLARAAYADEGVEADVGGWLFLRHERAH